MRNWKTVTGALVWVYDALQAFFDFLGTVDFLVERSKDLGWVGVVIDYMLNPPPSAIFFSLIIGGLLIYLGLKRHAALRLASGDSIKESNLDLPANVQDWRKVDPLYVWQAGCLWKGINPQYPVTFANPAYSAFSMLLRAVEHKEIKPVKRVPNSELAYAQISRSELKKFAASKGDSPEFLSDATSSLTLRVPSKRLQYAGLVSGLIAAAGVITWNVIDYRNQFITCTPKAEWQSNIIETVDPQLSEPAAVRQILLTRRSHTPYTMTILGGEGGLRNLNAVWPGMKPDSVSKREYGGIELLLKDPVGLISIIISPRKMADTKLDISFRCMN